MIDLDIELKGTKYRPIDVLALANRVIVMPIVQELADPLQAIKTKGKNLVVTSGGIAVLQKPDYRTFGVVVALGHEIDPENETGVQVGDVVYYDIAGTMEIDIKGKTYRHLRQRDVVARLFKNDNTNKWTQVEVYENRILLKPDEPLEKTIGGIILPEELQETPTTGMVLDLGPDLKSELSKSMVGAYVCYHKYGGTQIVYYDDMGRKFTFLAITESEVIALIKK